MYFKRNKKDDRNEQISFTMESIGNKAALLSAKTERLRNLRDHYEAYLNRVYPKKQNYIMEVYESKSRSYESIFVDEPSCVMHDIRPRTEDGYFSSSSRSFNRPFLDNRPQTSTSILDFPSTFRTERSPSKPDFLPEILISSEYLTPSESVLLEGVKSIDINSPSSYDFKFSQEDITKPILTTTTYPIDGTFDALPKIGSEALTTCDNCQRLRRSQTRTQSFAMRSRSYDASSPRSSDLSRSRSFTAKNSTSYLRSPSPHNINHYTATDVQLSTLPKHREIIQRIKTKANDLKLPFQKNTYIDDRIKYNLEKSKAILDRYSKSHSWATMKNSSMRDQYLDDALKQLEDRIAGCSRCLNKQPLFSNSFDTYRSYYPKFDYKGTVMSQANHGGGSYGKNLYKHVNFFPESTYSSSRLTGQTYNKPSLQERSKPTNYNYFPSSPSSISWYKTNYTSSLPDSQVRRGTSRAYSNITLPSEKYMNEFRKIPVYQRYLNVNSEECLKTSPIIVKDGKGVRNSKRSLHMPQDDAIDMESEVPKMSVEKALDEPLQEVSEQFYRLQTLEEKPVEMADQLDVREDKKGSSLKKTVVFEEDLKGIIDKPEKTEANEGNNGPGTAENVGVGARCDMDTTNDDLKVEGEAKKEREEREGSKPTGSLFSEGAAQLDDKQKEAVTKQQLSEKYEAKNAEATDFNQTLPTGGSEVKAPESDRAKEPKEGLAETSSVDKKLVSADADLISTTAQVLGSAETEQEVSAGEGSTENNLAKTQPSGKSETPAKKGSPVDGEETVHENNTRTDVLQPPIPSGEYYPEEDKKLTQEDLYLNEPPQQFDYDANLQPADSSETNKYSEEPHHAPYDAVQQEFEEHPDRPYETYQQKPYADHEQYGEQSGQQYETHPQHEEQSRLAYEEHYGEQAPTYDEHTPEAYDEQGRQPYREQTQQPYMEQHEQYDEHAQQQYLEQEKPYDKHAQQYAEQQQPYDEHSQQPYIEQKQYDEHVYEKAHPQYKDGPQYEGQEMNFPHDPNLYPEYKNPPEDGYNESQAYDQHQAQYEGHGRGSQDYHAPEAAYNQERAGTYSGYQEDYPTNDQNYRMTQPQEEYAPPAQGEEYVRRISGEYDGDYEHKPMTQERMPPQEEYAPAFQEEEYSRRGPEEYGDKYEPVPQEDYRAQGYPNADDPNQYVHPNAEYGQDGYEQREYQGSHGEFYQENPDYSNPEYRQDPRSHYSDTPQEYTGQQYDRQPADQNVEHYSQDAYHENYPAQDNTHYEDMKTPRAEKFREPNNETSNQ